jgi:hypothetical protein
MRASAISPVLVLMAACAVQEDRSDNSIPIGLLLSYSGYLAANSVNSERAVIMAIDAANVGGGSTAVGSLSFRGTPAATSAR